MALVYIIASLCLFFYFYYYFSELHQIKKEMNFTVTTSQEKKASIVVNKLSSYSKLISKLKIDLKKDRDTRPDKCLEELELLKDIMELELKNEKITVEIYNKFHVIFGSILDLLTESHDNWKILKDANGSYKKILKQKRETVVEKIQLMTQSLSDLVRQNVFETIDKVDMSDISELENAMMVENNVKVKSQEFNEYVNANNNIVEEQFLLTENKSNFSDSFDDNVLKSINKTIS